MKTNERNYNLYRCLQCFGHALFVSANKVFDSKMEAIVGELKAAVKSGKISERAAKKSGYVSKVSTRKLIMTKLI